MSVADNWEDLEDLEEPKDSQTNDEEIAESWEDLDEELEKSKKSASGTGTPVVQVKKKRGVQQAIKERQEAEAKKALELEKKRQQNNPNKEEIERKIVESDLENARELFGDGPQKENIKVESSIESIIPKSKEDFDLLSKLICKKVQPYHAGKLYLGFLETLFRDLVVDMNYTDIRQLSSSLNVLSNEKQKSLTNKAKKKPSKKATIKTDHSTLENYEASYSRDEEFDDFI